MAFLDFDFDLKDSRFSDEDLAMARQYLRTAIEKVAPSWLTNPVGSLASHWRSPHSDSACYLIWIAQVFWKLDRGITARSVPIFHRKASDLFRLQGYQHDELLTELEIAAGLTERISPISFEPLVPATKKKHEAPYSPDYELRLPDGDIFVEATIIRIPQLNSWDTEARSLAERLSSVIEPDSRLLTISAELPLDFRNGSISRGELNAAARAISRSSAGSFEFRAHYGQARLTWQVADLTHIAELGAVYQFGSSGYYLRVEEGTFVSALHIGWAPAFPPVEAMNELVLNSLRNTFDYKLRKWGHRQAPFVLAVKYGHRWLGQDGLTRLIAERVLNNPIYRKISGVLRYTPPQGFGRDDALHNLFLLTNDNALFPVGQSAWAIFGGTAEYHLP